MDYFSKDVLNIMTYIITAGAICGTVFWLDAYRVKQDRDRQLNEWVRRAREEKASKIHKVLGKQQSSAFGDDEEVKILSAEETAKQVLENKLDPRDNVIFLAKRCRDLANGEKSVNAIAEELYDEVRDFNSTGEECQFFLSFFLLILLFLPPCEGL